MSLQKLVVRTKVKKKESINFTWQHSHRPVRQSQPADHRLSHGHLHQVQAQKAAQQQDWVNVLKCLLFEARIPLPLSVLSSSGT